MDFTSHTEAQLADLFNSKTEEVAAAGAIKRAITAELNRRLAESSAAAFKAANKGFGQMHVNGADGTHFKAEAKKTVEWDQDMLQAVASKIPYQRFLEIATIKVSITEKSYGNCSPEELALINPARTVVIGEMQISPIKPKAVQEGK